MAIRQDLRQSAGRGIAEGAATVNFSRLMAGMALACLIGNAARAAEPVFACAFGDRSVAISISGDLMQYRFGPAAKAELELAIPLASPDLSHHFTLYAHASERWLRLRNGAYSYVAFTLFSTPNYDGTGGYDVAGLLVLKDDQPIARLDCDQPVQFGGTFDLALLPDDGEALSDILYEPVLDTRDDTISDFGLIAAVEDGPYPFFIISIEFPERQFTEDFMLNVEAVPLSDTDLMAMVGRYASFDYTATLEHALIDIESDGAMLLGTGHDEINPEWRSLTGTLRGAEALTQSDLPGEVRIEAPDGTITVFPYYVPGEFLRANGKVVTAFYTDIPRTEITRLEPAAD